MLSITEYIAESNKIAKEKGWHDSERTFGDYISLCHSELSEALEDFRKSRRYNEIYFKGNKPCGIPIELADLLIRIFDMCGAFDISLEGALNLKMEYNKTRDYRHGNKVI